MHGPTWVCGIIVEQLAPVTFLVEAQGGFKWKHHIIDHIKSLGDDAVINPEEMHSTDEGDYYPQEQSTSENTNSGTARYPSHQRQPPDHFMFAVIYMYEGRNVVK